MTILKNFSYLFLIILLLMIALGGIIISASESLENFNDEVNTLTMYQAEDSDGTYLEGEFSTIEDLRVKVILGAVILGLFVLLSRSKKDTYSVSEVREDHFVSFKNVNNDYDLFGNLQGKKSNKPFIQSDIYVNSGVGNWTLTTVHGEIWIAESWFETSGEKARKNNYLSNFLKSFNRKDQKELLGAFVEILDKGMAFDKTLQVTSEKYGEIWIRIVGYPVFENKKVVAAEGLFLNVDQEIRSNQLIQKLREKFETAQNAAKFGIWDWNIQKGFIDCSAKILEIYGLKSDKENLNFEDWKLSIHSEDKEQVEEEINKAIEGGKFDTRFRILQPSGDIRMIRAVAEVHRDVAGVPINLIGVNWDVTADFLETERINKYNEVIAKAESIARYGSYDYDMIHEKVEWSPQMYQIYGREIGSEISFEVFMDAVHQEDREKVEKYFENIIIDGHAVKIEHRLIQYQGYEKIVVQNAHIYYDKFGVPSRIIGTVHDLTLERQHEKRLISNLSFQKTLTLISHKLNKQIESDQAFTETMQIIGNSLGLNKVYIYQKDPFNSNLIPALRWNKQTKDDRKLKVISSFYLEEFVTFFQGQRKMRSLTELPTSISITFYSWGAGTVLLSPILIDQEFTGFLAFEDKSDERIWTKQELRFLETSYFMILNSFIERKAKTKLIDSQKMYQKLYNETPAMLFSIDSDIKVVSVSKYWLVEMGYHLEEVLGRDITDFMTEDSCQVFRNELYPIFMKEGRCLNIPMQYLKKSGELVEVLFSAICDTDIWGALLKVSVVITDITKEKEVENRIYKLNESLESKVKQRTAEIMRISNEMLAQKNLLESFINITPSMIFLKDIEGKYQIVNKEFIKVFGLTEQQVIGKTDAELFPVEVVEELIQSDKNVRDNNAIVEQEEMIWLNDEAHNYMSVRFPLHNRAGEIISIGGVSTDITLRKRQEERLIFQTEELKISNEILRKQKERLKESSEQLLVVNQELESFSYSVSHDLRAPLRALEGFSLLLSNEYKDKIDERGMKWLDFINDNTMKMDHLIKDLMEFSRVARYQVKKNPVKMELMIDEIIAEEKKNYKDSKIEISKTTILDAEVDQKIFKQVWINLISNAFKYSSKKEVIKIEITSVTKERFIQYSIKDYGAGFNNKYLGKLFGVFQRLHNESEFKGTGVGLAIVKKIINRHGGSIEAESTLGEGAKFTFYLPIKSEDTKAH